MAEFEVFSEDSLVNTVPSGCAIITDPPYELEPSRLAFMLRGDKNVIMFCKPENQFFQADEYLFWIKTPSTKNFTKNCGRFVEMILVKRGGVFNVLHWSQMIGVYEDRLIYPPTVHPYSKPLALMERLVRIYTHPGDTVYDPFMGSGTCGVACLKLGRNYIGREIVPENFQYAKNRLCEAKKGVYLE